MTREEKLQVWFEIEDNCNLDCIFCFDRKRLSVSRNGDASDTNQIFLVLRTLFSQTNVGTMAISGGEPLLRTDLDEILSYIKLHKVHLILTSNGTLLDKKKIARYLKLGVKTFQISLHSGDKTTHNYITGKSSWDDTIKAIECVRDCGGNAVIVFVATKINLSHFIDVLEIAAIFGLNKVIFNQFLSKKGSQEKTYKDLLITDDSKLNKVLSHSNEFARKHQLKIVLGTPTLISDGEKSNYDNIETTVCHLNSGQRKIILDKEGNVRLCIQSDHVLGNILAENLSSMLQSHQIIPLFSKKSEKIGGCAFYMQ